MESKKCIKCGIIKNLDEYPIRKDSKDNRRNNCIICYKEAISIRAKKWILKNKEKKSIKAKEWYIKNKDIKSVKEKERYLKNKKQIRNKHKEWYLNNREEKLIKNKEWKDKNKELVKKQNQIKYINNREAINKRNILYNNKRLKLDPLFKLRMNISCLINSGLRRKGFKKNSRSSIILGCSFDELMIHLNNNKYGFKYEMGGFDIDHIIPISTAKTEEELYKLNHHTNLQLLPSEYNKHIKINRPWDIEHFENWLNTR